MKKTAILISAFALAFASIADVAALYWQVGDTGIDYDYAKVRVTGGGLSDPSYLNSADYDGVSILANGDGATYADVSSYSSGSYSFFVELLNYENSNWSIVGHSDTLTYQDLVTSGYITTGGIAAPSVATAPFGLSEQYEIPEPTSGLLLLMGASMLALRRRRKE